MTLSRNHILNFHSPSNVSEGFLSLTTEAQEYRYHICSNETTFTPNSTYHSNLNRFLSSLTSNATLDAGYYNATVGQDPASRVYGSLLCRGDVTPDDCRNCSVTARDVAQQICPVEKVAVIWYDKCTLCYSNESFFGTLDETTIMMSNTQNITESEWFSPLVARTMNDMVAAASGAPSGNKKFATGEVKGLGLQTLYSLVQCTPDLSISDCKLCLQLIVDFLPTCCDVKRGGNVFNPSCNIRYELYPFYRVTALASSPAPALLPPPPPPVLLPPPSLPPESTIGLRGNAKISTTTIIAICVPIAVVFLLLIPIGCYWLKRRSRDEYNAVQNNQIVGNEITDVESLHFDLGMIREATDNFSDDNKLGEGGFGVVYKLWLKMIEGNAFWWARDSGEKALKIFSARCMRV